MNRRKCSIIIMFLAFAVMGLLLPSSCTIEASDNGDFDGFWHLERVDTLTTGGSCDLSDMQIFWGVNHKLLRLQGGGNGYYLRFRQTSDSLITSSPYFDGWHEDVVGGGDIPVTDVGVLYQYGIRNLEEHFVKETLSGSHMVLRSPELRLYFRKF